MMGIMWQRTVNNYRVSLTKCMYNMKKSLQVRNCEAGVRVTFTHVALSMFWISFADWLQRVRHRETRGVTVTDTIDIPEALVIDYLAFVVTSSTIIAWHLEASKSEQKQHPWGSWVLFSYTNKSHFIVKGMMTALLLSVPNVSANVNIFAWANSFKTNAFEVHNYIYNKITYRHLERKLRRCVFIRPFREWDNFSLIGIIKHKKTVSEGDCDVKEQSSARFR